MPSTILSVLFDKQRLRTYGHRTQLESIVHVMKVLIARHLRRHFDVPAECDAAGDTVQEIILDLERQFPGFASYVIHESGQLRQHVNVFLDDRFVRDRDSLSDSVLECQQIHIMQALSGG